MKSWKLSGIKQMEMLEIPDPGPPGRGQLLLRIEAVGVCGSDIHYYKTGRIGEQVVAYPFTVGHECAATVLEAGEGSGGFKPGDRVAVDPAMPCYECDQCLAGREHTCRNLKFLGCPGQAEGCLSEMIIMTARSCFKIPETMSFAEAAFAEPLSIGYYAVQLSGIRTADRVAILGAGPIGDSVLVSSKEAGAGPIYVTDRIDRRLDIASHLGAEAAYNVDKSDAVKGIITKEPALLDIVYECCGQQEAFDQAVELLKPGGKLMIVGIPEFDRWSFRADTARRKEISIIHVRRQNGCMQPALDLVSRGRVDTQLLITHTFPFSQAKEAFDLVAGYKHGVLKAIVDVKS
ncbi:MAG: alcohol dehydrogenase catalytic domain-containing protein [Bacteroidales bacterium]|nr:alcohol dehydrogenase catalytic domain-containing protein [Bacteroidales bacterium]